MPAAPFTPPPVTELDADKISSALLRIVMLAAQLGHESPSGTARDYLTTITDPEMRFVRDVLSRSTEQVCDEWFGGLEHAAVTLTRNRTWDE